jgi:hypothetical protein
MRCSIRVFPIKFPFIQDQLTIIGILYEEKHGFLGAKAMAGESSEYIFYHAYFGNRGYYSYPG